MIIVLTNCLACQSDKLIEFLDLGKQPLANKYPTKEELGKETFVDLKALFCPVCKTVQLPASSLISRDTLFRDYYYASSVMAGLKTHFAELAEEIRAMMYDKVVDVGSNDGILLEELQKHGLTAIGVEPAENMAKISGEKGLITINEFFDTPTTDYILSKYGKIDVVVASNIFTHLVNLKEFIQNASRLLVDNGMLIIEVEYFVDIVRDLQFERFYSDHTFYFTLSSLFMLFSMYHMSIVHAEYIETHGGSIRIYVKNGLYESDYALRTMLKFEYDTNYNILGRYQEFARYVKEVSSQLKKQLELFKSEGKTIAGYGAPARLTTITNYAQIGPDLVQYVVDDNPLKQNRYSPGMHIPIVNNDYLMANPPDVLIVFAHNYLEEIKKKCFSLKDRSLLYIPIPPHSVPWN